MNEQEKEALENYFTSLKDLSTEQLVANVSNYLDDEAIEMFVDHIEDFYGVEDDEELGMLAQLMVSGFVAGRSISQ